MLHITGSLTRRMEEAVVGLSQSVVFEGNFYIYLRHERFSDYSVSVALHKMKSIHSNAMPCEAVFNHCTALKDKGNMLISCTSTKTIYPQISDDHHHCVTFTN